jgi:uncharacterized damage-inducible protein DinB
MSSHGDFLSHYHRVRGRTERLVPLIPEAAIEWRPVEGAFSFGDVLRHLAGVERWMWAENVLGRPSRYPGHAVALAPGYRPTIEYASRCRDEAAGIFGTLSEEDMARRVATPGGATLPVWKWLRAMIEHEAHHRGQLYLMLRLRGIATPPLYGLTSEEVQRAGASSIESPRSAAPYRP